MIIIGSGPAGLAAAIYAQRAKLDTLVLEKEMMSGGQVLNTYEVDNYPGLPGINGFDLGSKFRQHAEGLEAVFAEDEVLCVELANREEGDAEEDDGGRMGEGVQGAEADRLQAAEVLFSGTGPEEGDLAGIEEGPPVADGGNFKGQHGNGRLIWKKVVGKKGSYLAKTVIIAAGATHRKLGVAGEQELAGRGISYCATCDGAFFKKKVTAVVGGGDVALEDAIFLARMCSHVYLIHRRDTLRGAKSLQEKAFALKNVTVVWDTVVEGILGGEKVNGLALKNVKTGALSQLEVDGVFIAVGISPNTGPFQGLLKLEHGYIQAGEDGETEIPGVYAAGDIRTKQLRQIVTAAADGANAVTSAERYLAKY